MSPLDNSTTKLSTIDPTEAEPSSTTNLYQTVGPRRSYLVMLAGAEPGKRYSLAPETLIGRDDEAQICLEADDISRRHATISQQGDGSFLLTDLQSSNGTFVNEEPIQTHTLRSGDKIKLAGHTLLLFSQQEEVEEKLLQSQRLESIGHLAGGVSHDFNNLIGSVLANVNFIQDLPPSTTTADPEVRECLADMANAGRRAAELTRHLLSFARGNASQLDEPIDLSNMTTEALRLARRTFDPKIEISAELGRSCVVMGDPSQLHQVLMNLLINARDAMADGGKLVVKVSQIVLSAPQHTDLPLLGAGRYAVLSVMDTGVGMPPEAQRRIFDPFFSTKGRIGGTGLGLATAHGIVKQHGGGIRVDSQPGTGTTMCVYLPFTEATPRKQVLSRRTTMPAGANSILVVDDDEGIRNGTRRLLQQLGHQVRTTDNGHAALDLLGQYKIDLVLLDLVMPRITGRETFAHIRQQHPEVQVLLITGYSDTGLIRELLDAGACGCLMKPYDKEELRGALIDAFNGG